MNLIDVLITEQLNEIFREAHEKRADVDLEFFYGDQYDYAPAPVEEVPAVRVATPSGQSWLVTPRRIAQEVGEIVSDFAVYTDLTGFDWISTEMASKVEQKDDHYDRLYLYLKDGRTRVMDGLGEAVYPLMTFFAKVLELRSEKVLLRALDDDVIDVLGKCLNAAARGPFFEDDELEELFGHDRGSLVVIAGRWPHLNLAAPELHHIVTTVTGTLMRRRDLHRAAWDDMIAEPVERVDGAVAGFRAALERAT